MGLKAVALIFNDAKLANIIQEINMESLLEWGDLNKSRCLKVLKLALKIVVR